MRTLRALATVGMVLTALGCAGRTAPFNEMDEAAFTVYKLQGQETAPPAAAATPGAPGLAIPGLPPELTALGQQAGAALQQILPPGLLPPGLVPGQGTVAAPIADTRPRFKGFVILGQMPLSDQEVKDEILDVFGDEGSFQGQTNNCFFPGLGVSMSRAAAAPVDVLVSLSCNQAQGDGFRWPYPVNGLTPETSQRMTKVYEKMFGPVPPGS
ncbi:MAG: hypothetical protein WKG00_02325 [Polyangiaceae bacterium]